MTKSYAAFQCTKALTETLRGERLCTSQVVSPKPLLLCTSNETPFARQEAEGFPTPHVHVLLNSWPGVPGQGVGYGAIAHLPGRIATPREQLPPCARDLRWTEPVATASLLLIKMRLFFKKKGATACLNKRKTIASLARYTHLCRHENLKEKCWHHRHCSKLSIPPTYSLKRLARKRSIFALLSEECIVLGQHSSLHQIICDKMGWWGSKSKAQHPLWS